MGAASAPVDEADPATPRRRAGGDDDDEPKLLRVAEDEHAL
jgi:hypothetical protein